MNSFNKEAWEYVEDLKIKLSAAAASNVNNREPISDLYKHIYSEMVLYCAYKEMKKKSKMPGIDGETWDMIEKKGARKYIRILSQQLRDKSYKPSPLLAVSLEKQDGGYREIRIPTVKDRIVQKAATILIDPILNESFIDSSYAYRPRRSPIDAVSALINKVDKGYVEVLSADIVKCFDNIDRINVKDNLHKAIDDKDLLRLISEFMEVTALTKKGLRVSASNGLHQGTNLAPLLSNVAMNNFDLWFYENISELFDAELIRYSDDFLVLAPKIKPELEEEIADYLKGQGLSIYGLEKRPKIINLRSGEPVNFLGYEIRMTRVKPIKLDVIPRSKSIQRLLYRIGLIIKEAEAKYYIESELIDKMNQVLRGFEGYYRLCNKLMVFDHVNNKIEAMLKNSIYNNDSILNQVYKISLEECYYV